jgi:hypothetical protein
MDQGAITSIKRCFRADLLRTLANEDDSITKLREKNDGVGRYIQCISGMVFHESSNTGSWRKLLPDLQDDLAFLLRKQHVQNSWYDVSGSNTVT